MAEDRAPCERCETEIQADSLACPECGYEPGSSLKARILAELAVLVALPSYVALVVLTILAGDLRPPTLLVGVVVSASVSVAASYVVWEHFWGDRRTATDSGIF